MIGFEGDLLLYVNMSKFVAIFMVYSHVCVNCLSAGYFSSHCKYLHLYNTLFKYF